MKKKFETWNEDAEQASENFLKDLTVLTLKYGLVVEGCGCCESPWLTIAVDENKTEGYLKWDSVKEAYRYGNKR